MGNMRVIEGAFGKTAPAGLAEELRRLADAVDQGEVVEFVGCWIENDQFVTNRSASLEKQIVLSTLLQRQTVDGLFSHP
jgi:hypothetical protein